MQERRGKIDVVEHLYSLAPHLREQQESSQLEHARAASPNRPSSAPRLGSSPRRPHSPGRSSSPAATRVSSPLRKVESRRERPSSARPTRSASPLISPHSANLVREGRVEDRLYALAFQKREKLSVEKVFSIVQFLLIFGSPIFFAYIIAWYCFVIAFSFLCFFSSVEIRVQ